jgi:hypothetical protein
MSKIKEYMETISEEEGYGGELTEEFLARWEAGEFKDTLMVIDKETGMSVRTHASSSQYWPELEFAGDAINDGPEAAEARMRAGEVIVSDGYVRMMVASMLDYSLLKTGQRAYP